MTYDEFMRGYEEYKQNGGAGGNSGASLQWGANAGGQGDGQPAPNSGHGMTYDEFMRGYEEYKRQGGKHGMSYDEFMEGYYQRYPERRPVQTATASAPAAQGTGMALGGGTVGVQQPGTPEPGSHRAMAQARYGALQSSASQAASTSAAAQTVSADEDEGGPRVSREEQARRNQELLAGLNWMNKPTTLPGAVAESGWTAQSAQEAAEQATRIGRRLAVQWDPTAKIGGRGAWTSAEGRDAVAQMQRESPTRIADMTGDYFLQAVKDSGRSFLQGAGALMSGTALSMAQAQNPNVALGMESAYPAAYTPEQQEQLIQGAKIAQGMIDDLIRQGSAAAQQEGEALSEKYQDVPTAEGNLARWVGGGAGSMAGQIAAGAFLGPAASSALIFGQGVGDYYANALEDGATSEQALAAGMLGGGANLGIEKVFGGVPLAGEGMVPVGEILQRYMRSRTGRMIINRIAEATGEGLEEVAENYIQPLVQKLTYDKEIEWPELTEQLDAFAGGFAASLVTGGLLEDAPQQSGYSTAGAQLRAAGGETALLAQAQQAAQLAPKTEAGRMARKVLADAAKAKGQDLSSADLGALAEKVSDADLGALEELLKSAREAGTLPGVDQAAQTAPEAGAEAAQAAQIAPGEMSPADGQSLAEDVPGAAEGMMGTAPAAQTQQAADSAPQILMPGIDIDMSGALLGDPARQTAVQFGRVSESELDAIDRMAQAKGLRVRYVYQPKSAVDGWISGNIIHVNLGGESSAFGAAVHETGHAIKAADATRFARFEQAVMRLAGRDAELGRYAQAVRDAYTAETSPARASLLGADGQIDEAALNEEVALKLAEQLVGDPEKMTEAVTRERGLGEVLLDFIRGIKNSIAIKLKGSQKAMLDEAERTLVNLLRGDVGSVDGQRLSVQTDEDGHKYVKIDVDQNIFEGKTLQEKIEIAREYMKEHFRGHVLDVGDSNAYVNGRSVEEYAYPANRRLSYGIREAKARASTELDHLLSVSTYLRHDSDDGRHKNATGGWDTYRTEFELGDERFTGEVKIMNTGRGRLFYDITHITQIEKSPVSANSQRLALGDTTSDLSAKPPVMAIYPREARAPHQAIPQGSMDASFNPNVAQDGETVNAEKADAEGKDSLSVPYRTQQGKTLQEYLQEQYPGMIWPIVDAKTQAAGASADLQAAMDGLIRAGQEQAEKTNATMREYLNMATGGKLNVAGVGAAQAQQEAAQSQQGGAAEAAQEQQSAEKAQSEAEQAQQAESQAEAANGPALKESAKSLEIQKRATTAFVDRVGDALSVPRWAKREFLRPIAQQLAQTLKTEGRIDQALADEMFEQAYKQGIMLDDEMVQQYGDLRKEIRGTALRLDRETAQGRDAGDLHKRYFGTLNITKDGLPIDSYYQDLCERYPELFDPEITHPADQAERIYEVCRDIKAQEMDLDAYYGEDAEKFKRFARDGFDQALEEMTDGVYKVRRLEMDNAEAMQIAREEIEPISYAEVERIQHEVKKLQREEARIMNRAALTKGDNKIVDQLLNGGTSEEFLRSKGQENLDDILKVYRAKKAVQDAKRPVQEYNAKVREQRAARAQLALEGTENWTDKKQGLRYSMETMQRNIRDISHKDEAGRRMVEEYFAPVQVHEAASTRMKNEVRAKIKALGLNQWESAYTQIYGELEALEDVPWKADERAQLTQAMEELMEEHGNEISRPKAQAAVQAFRQEYDKLFDMANQALVQNGYAPIEYRKGYFPHFDDNQTDSLIKNLAELVGRGSNPDELPTAIAGLTAGFKPGKRWNPHEMERTGFKTSYDALKGFDLYLEVTADVIHHTEDIRNLRALEEAIRYKYGDEGVKEEIRKIRADETLTDAQRDEKVAAVQAVGKSHLSNFVQELSEYTNLLAGKKSRFDRWMEYAVGRGAYRVMSQIENRVAANMVALNLGSWLTNFLPVAQVAAEVGQGNMLRAARDVAKNWWHDDGFTNRSDFLTNRGGSTMLSRSKLQKASDFLSKPMQMIDDFASSMVTRAYYYKNLQDGMGEVEAIQTADRQAAGLMADRSKGALPTLFGSKNPVTRLFTMYQVEVNNTLRHIFKDIPDLSKKASEMWGMILVGFLYSYIFNDLYEQLTGRRCALDPLDIINEAVGALGGVEMPNLIEEGGKVLRGEASMEDFKTEPKGVAAGVTNMAGNLAQELPFVGGVLGGGRLPISAAFPDVGNIVNNIGGLVDGDKSGLQALYGVGKELAKPALYVAMPIGGGQLKKTVEGVSTMARGGYYKQGKDGEQLQTAVDQNMANWLKAMTFGRSAITEVGEYYDSGRRGLTADQTAIIKELGMSPTEGQQWMQTFGGRGDNADRSNYYEVRFGEEAADLDARLAGMAEAGASGILPSKPSRKLTVDGEEVELSAAAYREYQETRAAGSYELLGYLPEIESAGADAALQADYAKKVQEYMAEVAKSQATGAEVKPWVADAREYAGAEGAEVNVRLANAIIARAVISAAKADKQPNGKSVPGSRKRNALEALERIGFGAAEAEELWEVFG